MLDLFRFLELFHDTDDIYIEVDGEIVGKYTKRDLPEDLAYYPINGASLKDVNGKTSLVCEVGYEFLGEDNPFIDSES